MQPLASSCSPPQPLSRGRADSVALGMDAIRLRVVRSAGRLKMGWKRRLLRGLREDTISWPYHEKCLGYPTFLPKLLYVINTPEPQPSLKLQQYNMTYFLYVTDSTRGKMFHKPELKLQDRGSLVLNALKEFYMDLISWQRYIFKRKNTVLHVE